MALNNTCNKRCFLKTYTLGLLSTYYSPNTMWYVREASRLRFCTLNKLLLIRTRKKKDNIAQIQRRQNLTNPLKSQEAKRGQLGVGFVLACCCWIARRSTFKIY